MLARPILTKPVNGPVLRISYGLHRQHLHRHIGHG
jgi:hypothetical protein